jgi:diacylglycerol O-acyltransferase
MRIGIAIFSYNGEVNFGITGDYDTTADLDVLTAGIEDGMAQMVKLSGSDAGAPAVPDASRPDPGPDS